MPDPDGKPDRDPVRSAAIADSWLLPWNLDAAKLPYLKLAADRGLGTTGFESLLKRVASRAGRQPSRYAEAFESASCCALAFTACMSSLPVPSVGRAST